MIYKEYGKTGIKLSAVGFGGMRFNVKRTDEENAELLLYAHSSGINYFDTAPAYCEDHSIDIFGIAFKQMRSRRDKFYVGTKAMPTKVDTADGARREVENALKRLNLERVDFFYVWCIRKMGHYETAMKKGGLYEGLQKCKEQGLIDHIVISTHLPGPQIKQIIERGEFDGVLLGVNILNFPYRWQAVQAAYNLGCGVIVMNPLGGGAIPQHEEQFKFLAAGNESPTEAAIRFCVSCPQITVALVGFTTKEHIDMACNVAERCRPFTNSDIERVKSHLSENMDTICTGCGYCLDTCPQDIPVPSYMQVYNERALFGKSDDDMVKHLAFSHDWGLLVDRAAEAADCIQCGQCEEACTQHINITDHLAQIAEWEKQAEKEKKTAT